MKLTCLPLGLLKKIGRYLHVIDHVKLQMMMVAKIEETRIIRLRYRYEPIKIKNITCKYVKGEFLLTWSHNGHNMFWHDRKSRSNREAVKCMDDLLN